MIVICQYKTGENIPIGVRRRGETDETEYSQIKIGEKYAVYGIMFFSHRIEYLICPVDSGPLWSPSDLFNIFVKQIPAWSFCAAKNNLGYRDLSNAFGVNSLIGYESLVSNYSHYVGILERDPIHLKEFYLMKESMDKVLILD